MQAPLSSPQIPSGSSILSLLLYHRRSMAQTLKMDSDCRWRDATARASPPQHQQVEGEMGRREEGKVGEWGKVSAILFDMDRVLCNSEEPSRMATVDIFTEMGISVTIDNFVPFMGTAPCSKRASEPPKTLELRFRTSSFLFFNRAFLACRCQESEMDATSTLLRRSPFSAAVSSPPPPVVGRTSTSPLSLRQGLRARSRVVASVAVSGEEV